MIDVFFDPGISRIDFVGEAENDGERICLILECQSKIPNDDDISSKLLAQSNSAWNKQ